MKRIQWKPFLICLAIPLAVGGLAALLTGSGMDSYAGLRQPPLSPPPAAFPIVWAALYLLMGVSSYLVWTSSAPQPARVRALRPYALQLFFNFIWPLLFFRLGAYLAAFVWLLALIALVAAMILAFRKLRPAAAWLQLPYLAWAVFAGYLNFGVWLLNG